MAARIRCIRRKCTCGRPLGRLQAQFEIMLRDCKDPGDDDTQILNNLGAPDTVLGVLHALKCKKMCCLLNMEYPPSYPLVDANVGAVTDDTGLINQMLDVRRERYVVESGPSVYMEDVPSFPSFGSK